MKAIRQWLASLPLPADYLQREQAPLLQTLLLGLISAVIAAVFLTLNTVGAFTFVFPVLTLWAVSYSLAFILLRRTYFLASLQVMTFGLLIGLFILFIPRGVNSDGGIYVLTVMPILLTGLLGTRRMMWSVVACTVLFFGIIVVLDHNAPHLVGYITSPTVASVGVVAAFAIVTLLPALAIDRFSNKLRSSIAISRQREQELEAIRVQQETIIAERTQHLTRALNDIQQREQQQAQTLAELQVAQEAVRTLSVPVLPVLDRVLAVPLIGEIDQARAEALMGNTLAAVEREQARYVIFDITGVPIVDTHVARVLMHTADAIRLMGAQVILAGVQPEVAQIMVSLGLDLHNFSSHADLRSALAFLKAI